jgi:nicotinamidase-related amidase
VIATALAAADAGKHVRVVRDACAASTPENGAAALAVMSLFAPQLTLVGR